MFIFYDLLPTAAELAGVDRASWPVTDGTSAVPIFDASRADRTTKLESTSASANRFLYYEFCHNGMVNGLLKQSYASGWGQAVRFDDNTTQYETQWKAIAVDSNYTNVLLYNITDDQSESVPLAGTAIHGSIEATFAELGAPAREAGDPAQYPPVVANALTRAINLFRTQHVENPYWKSSKNASDPCCASCFTPGGCKYPCKKFPGSPTPPPSPVPPTPPSPPSPPISMSMLVGDWNAKEGAGSAVFTLSIDSTSGTDVVTIGNPGDTTSCWKTGKGGWDKQTNTITNIVCTGCDRNATGVVKKRTVTKVIDHDYIYAGEVLDLVWTVSSGQSEDYGSKGRWPKWTKMVKGYEIVLEQ
jgi:hypothetical protein